MRRQLVKSTVHAGNGCRGYKDAALKWTEIEYNGDTISTMGIQVGIPVQGIRYATHDMT